MTLGVGDRFSRLLIDQLHRDHDGERETQSILQVGRGFVKRALPSDRIPDG